jgi:predicted nucleic acid-binding protein
VKVFLDANVLFSASFGGSGIHSLVGALSEKFTVITSDFACFEAHRNLRLKRKDWLPTFTDLQDSVEVVPSIDSPLEVALDAKDRPILATAINHQCAYLVTGDRRDFGHLMGKTIGPTRVVTPAGIAKLLIDSKIQ